MNVFLGASIEKKKIKTKHHNVIKHQQKHRATTHHTTHHRIRDDPVPATADQPVTTQADAPGSTPATGGAEFKTCEPSNIASIHAVHQTKENRCWAATGAAIMSATQETTVSEDDVVSRVVAAGATLGEEDALPLANLDKYQEVVGLEEVLESFTLEGFCALLNHGPLVLIFQTSDRMGHVVMVIRAQGTSDSDMQVSYIDPDDVTEKLVPITRLRELYTEETFGHLYKMKESAPAAPVDPPAQ